MRDSPTLIVLKNLINDYKIFGHDPMVSKEEIENTNAIPIEIEEGFKNADCVIIMKKNLRI